MTRLFATPFTQIVVKSSLCLFDSDIELGRVLNLLLGVDQDVLGIDYGQG